MSGVKQILQKGIDAAKRLASGTASAQDATNLVQTLNLAYAAAQVADAHDQEAFRQKASDVLRVLPNKWIRLSMGFPIPDGPTNGNLSTGYPINFTRQGIVTGFACHVQGATQDAIAEGMSKMALAITREDGYEMVTDGTTARLYFPFSLVQSIGPSNVPGWQPFEQAVNPGNQWTVVLRNEGASGGPWKCNVMFSFLDLNG